MTSLNLDGYRLIGAILNLMQLLLARWLMAHQSRNSASRLKTEKLNLSEHPNL